MAKFFGSRFISRAVKTENPFPRSFFAPKPNGNACYAGYIFTYGTVTRGFNFILKQNERKPYRMTQKVLQSTLR